MSVKALKRATVEALERKSAKTSFPSVPLVTTLKRKYVKRSPPAHASTIVLANRQRTKKINTRLLKPIVSELLAELDIFPAELGINLIAPREMARVNWQFLRHEGSTDVITFDHRSADGSSAESFDHNESASADSPLVVGVARGISRPATLHGELFVCVEEAVKQAAEFRTSWQTELVRYVVHGVLHLLGHDDVRPELRRKMKREENRLVRRLGKKFPLSQLHRGLPIAARSADL
jgi:probable rRNA maturation factor